MKRIDYLMMVENLKRITKTYHVYSLNFVVHPWTLPDEVKEAIAKIEKNNDFVNVYIDGKDSSKLIGFKGEVINSLQNILNFKAFICAKGK